MLVEQKIQQNNENKLPDKEHDDAQKTK